jgi:hypothetical protein
MSPTNLKKELTRMDKRWIGPAVIVGGGLTIFTVDKLIGFPCAGTANALCATALSAAITAMLAFVFSYGHGDHAGHSDDATAGSARPEPSSGRG